MSRKSREIALAFTEIKVADWPGAVRWYVEILGLRPVLEDAARQFVLLEAGGGGGRLALKAGAASGVASNVRLVFQVEDVDLERDRLLALGVDVGPVSDDRVEGYRDARLVDPEGMPITLFSWPSAS